MNDRFIHKHGGGFIRGVEGAISSDSYLERGAEIRGKTFVSFMSTIRGEAVVDDSSVTCSIVEKSIVLASQISYAKVENSALKSVIIRGVHDPALVRNAMLEDGVVVEGCRVENFALAGPFLLHSDFNREPRHFDLKEFGISLGIIECCHERGVPRAICGCACRPITEWIEKKELLRRLFRKRHRWVGPEVDLIHEYFKLWLSNPT